MKIIDMERVTGGIMVYIRCDCNNVMYQRDTKSRVKCPFCNREESTKDMKIEWRVRQDEL